MKLFNTPLTFILGLLLLIFCQQEETAPNILFIFTDDHCEQAISAYGSKIIDTPNMDRIANEGIRFNRCYVTNSICGPSRAVIQTGKYSHMNGKLTNGGKFKGDQQTFPKLMQASGCQTAIIGKWHLGSTPRGYDLFCVLKGQGPYNNPSMLTSDREGNISDVKHTGYTTDIITELTLDWLKNQRDKGKPFMLMCQHKAPHRNWVSHEKYQDWLDDVTIPEPETFWDDYSGRTPPASRQRMEVGKHLNTKDLKLDLQGKYAKKNEAFWKAMPGMAENTEVIYSSDQGWYLGEHGWFDKRWMYEESLKTPLLVRWPEKISPGSVSDDIVSNVDYHLCKLAIWKRGK